MKKKELATTINSVEEINNELISLKDTLNNLNKLNSEMENEIKRIKDKYLPKISSLQTVEKSIKENITNFCELNKKEFNTTKVFQSGEVKIVKNPDKLALVKKSLGWDNVVGVLKKYELNEFIIVEEKPNKDSIKNDLTKSDDRKITGKILEELNIKIEETHRIQIDIYV